MLLTLDNSVHVRAGLTRFRRVLDDISRSHGGEPDLETAPRSAERTAGPLVLPVRLAHGAELLVFGVLRRVGFLLLVVVHRAQSVDQRRHLEERDRKSGSGISYDIKTHWTPPAGRSGQMRDFEGPRGSAPSLLTFFSWGSLITLGLWRSRGVFPLACSCLGQGLLELLGDLEAVEVPWGSDHRLEEEKDR
ncbi:hypothetical protein EYF80_026919 [Liparis tanakae]|uniref:Uncharacterized protein n=1 Tax=Liparis tanakae TaxID=230148 RepID=A0A4Z2HD77_9TELE|nr:hypothetical protein EYF80_026919 [Liparis tanakae]